MILSKKVFNAALLVAGTTIGAGMLALPIVTAKAGFLPSLVVFFICYLFMMATGLLMTEALFWYQGELNLMTLASRILGPWGKWASWVLYLFLFYTLSVAYIAGGGDILQNVFGWPKGIAEAVFLLTLSFFVMKGASALHRVNAVLMVGMGISYAFLIMLGWKKVEVSHLQAMNLSQCLVGLPVVFTSFSYQGVIPSLKTYLNGDRKGLRKAIIIGVTLPFLFYVIWQAFIMGLIPQSLLMKFVDSGKSAIFPLEQLIDSPWIFSLGKAFAFFAIATSFLGVTVGLKDFLQDGLRFKGKTASLSLFLVTFLPPFIIAKISFNAFITALRFAGGIGCALLLGLFPIMMVWKGRYKLDHEPSSGFVLKQKSVLFILGAFAIAEVLVELDFLIF